MKTTEELYQELLADFEGRIGQSVSNSCDLAVRLYAVAAQVEALYAQADWVARQCFPQTAEEAYLDYHAQMRGLTRAAAVRAEGTLRFAVRQTVQEELTVPKGTVCLTGRDVRYETVEDAVLAAGQTYVDVPARAVEAGSGSNTGAGTVLAMSVPPAGIVSCTNPEAFTGGADAEGNESLRRRVLDSFRRLPNGANAAFYETEAMGYPGVAAAKAVGRARGVGTVDVYVATTAGVPDAALTAAIQADLDAKREIAVDLQVKAPTTAAVNVGVALQAAEGHAFETVKARAEEALRAYFSGARLAEPVLLSELYAVLHEVEGIGRYRVVSPAADIAAAPTVLPVLGTLSVTAEGAQGNGV